MLKLEVDEFFDQKSPEFQKEIVKEYFRRNHESVPVLNITCANGTNITYYKFPCKRTFVNASEDEMDLEEMTVEEDLVEEGDDGEVDTPDNDNNEEADDFTNDLFEKLIIEPPVQDEDNDHNSNENQNDSKRKEYLAAEASFTNNFPRTTLNLLLSNIGGEDTAIGAYLLVRHIYW